ncbi:MAG: hypothetical protein JWN93_679 [Hyphomicrobiales bacterium]|nr:hypothetical protein [Hyphomicrobiales bacterium]
MNQFADYTKEEWARILASPIIVGIAVTAADPSGLWGVLKESLASGWALLQSRQSQASGSMVKAVADDFSSAEGRTAAREQSQKLFSGLQSAAITRTAIDELQQVATLVRAKSPAEAAAFSAWLQSIAVKAAEASSEGGFLGFGGVQVSDAEKATLAQIQAALAPPTTA